MLFLLEASFLEKSCGENEEMYDDKYWLERMKIYEVDESDINWVLKWKMSIHGEFELQTLKDIG